MMPVIRLSDATFSELKAIATWLSAKTPSETIDRLVVRNWMSWGLNAIPAMNQRSLRMMR